MKPHKNAVIYIKWLPMSLRHYLSYCLCLPNKLLAGTISNNMSIENIGIVGGGQLGRMLIEEDPFEHGFYVVDPTPDSPASQVGANQIKSDLTDAGAIGYMASQVDVVTIEIEHVNEDKLIQLSDAGHIVHPSPRSLKVIKDKLHQKQHFQELGLPVADFKPTNNETDYQQALDSFGNIIVKVRSGGFDGRGNLVIGSQSWAEVRAHFDEKYPSGVDLYAERVVPYRKELAVLVARTRTGDTAVYPVVETIHKDNICNMVLSPAPIDHHLQQGAEEIGRLAAKSFEGAGIFAIELFLDEYNNILINEVAPRVHNSGHHTIEANETSQFEQHIRAITGRPLGPTRSISPAAVMINILGEHDRPVQLSGSNKVRNTPNTYLHMYGKSPTRVARKMGHITVLASSLKEAVRGAKKARSQISI